MCAGGKWTTYRRMAEDAVDLACVNGRVPAGQPCQTSHLALLGAHDYDPALFTEVAQNYTVPHRPGAIDTRVAKHLAGSASCPLQVPAVLLHQLTCRHPGCCLMPCWTKARLPPNIHFATIALWPNCLLINSTDCP